MEVFFPIAFATGLASSFHCIGMCGPIALALPTGRLTWAQELLAKALYNFGRIITYSTFGLIFGFFGKKIFLAGFQQNLSIFLGLFLILSLFGSAIYRIRVFGKITHWVSDTIRKVLPQKNLTKFLFLGLLNGLLPCGMVYIALAGALAIGSITSGALFMALFGLGTVPLMFSISILPKFVNFETRKKINKYLPAYTLLLGIFFIIRGLGIGLPYISPKFEKSVSGKTITICHNTKLNK